MVTEISGEPSVMDFSCHRQFLQSYFEYKKLRRSGFSYRRFSQLCGFKSPNYLQLVIKGQRNLSREAVEKMTEALKLTPQQKKYFRTLVDLETTQDTSLKATLALELQKLSTKIRIKTISQAYRQIVSQWYHLVIREFVLLEEFRAEGAWISQKLYGLVSAEEAEKSLELMLQAGFLKKDGLRLVQTEPTIDTGNNFGELDVLQAHSQTLQAWARIIFRTNRNERECGLLNIPLKREQIPELVSRIRQFQNDLIAWLQDTQEPDTVVQVGTYMIPIVKK